MRESQKDAYERRIKEASGDRSDLAAISEELREVSALWASVLRFKIGQIIKQSNDSADESAQVKKPSRFEERFLALGLPQPDGRPLYQYRLSSEAFDLLKSDLAKAANSITNGNLSEASFFVLWAAEWFRRCYRGGIRKWKDVGDEIGIRLEQAQWRNLTDMGLKQWGLKAVTLNGVNHRLLALARQGGFPVAAIEGDGHNWAAGYLEKLVGHLLARTDIIQEDVIELAKELRGHIPETWQYDDFYALSADLASAVVRLRREAEQHAAAMGMTASVWLEINQPNWRDTLPVVTDSDTGARLIDGLMRAAPLRGASGSLRAIRLLQRGPNGWQPAMRLQLSGTIKTEQLNQLHSEIGRLRAYAAGRLAQYISGELAILEPPSEAENAWVARSTRRTTPEFLVPFDTPAEIELRAEGHTVRRILMPGGDVLRGPMLVFAVQGGSDVTEPVNLSIAGTSSGRYRADPLFLHIPENWTAEPGEDGDKVESIGDGILGHQLWRVTSGAIVRSPDDDTYLIRAGQVADSRDQLIVNGKKPPYIDPLAHDIRLFCGPPIVRLKDNNGERVPTMNELWRRNPAAGKPWAPAALPLAIGVHELAWKDAKTGHLRDCCKVAVLPEHFRFQPRTSGDFSEVMVEGWTGFSIPEGATEISPGRWQIGANASRDRLVRCRLRWDNGCEVVSVFTPSHKAGFAYWEAGFLRPNDRFALADAKNIVALADRSCEMMALVKDRNGHIVDGAELRWRFDRELPLSAIREDIESLLLPLGDLDANVVFNFIDGNDDHWYAKQFDIELSHEPRGLVASKAIDRPDVRVVGRSMAIPTREQDFGNYTLGDSPNHRPISLPENLKGVWLIYLRAGDRVLSRPKLHYGGHSLDVASDPLGRVMTIEDKYDRQRALDEFYASAEGENTSSHRIIRSIIELSASLNGLPPSTFDVLMGLCKHPKLAARLAFFASEDEIPFVLSLSNGLPFCWFLFSKTDWDDAAKSRAQQLYSAMESLPQAPVLVADDIGAKRRVLSDTEPALTELLNLPAPRYSLKDVAQTFMNRSADRVSAFGLSPFRPGLDAVLPHWNFDESFHLILDAPCAAALAALGRFQPDDKQVRRIKAISRSHPRYFAEAFTAYYQENIDG
ncbi:MAG: STY4851/ECs_5259 family protein [Pseudomonadota bacterium]